MEYLIFLLGRLLRATCFLLNGSVLLALDQLKRVPTKARLGAIRHDVPFSAETDAPDYTLTATSSQDGQPVALHVL